MTYQSVKRTRLIAKKTKLETQITTLETTLDSLLSSEVEEYKYDSGEGSQRVKRRSFDEVQKQLDKLETRLEHTCQQLAGLGVVNIRLRRRRDTGSYPHGGSF